MRNIALAVLMALGVSVAAADEQVVAIADLVKDPAAMKGRMVTVPDCLVLSMNTIVGAQCTTKPMDPSLLAYIDADSWTAEAGKTLAECDTTDITKLCLLKVTGEIDVNSRGQALIKKATVEILERTSAM